MNLIIYDMHNALDEPINLGGLGWWAGNKPGHKWNKLLLIICESPLKNILRIH